MTLWTFLNSPIGILIVTTLIGSIAGWLFKKQPKWEKFYDRHKGVFFDAVRWAEGAIPDDTRNKSAAKLDAALRYILQMDPYVTITKTDLAKGINKAHAEVEAKKALSAPASAAEIKTATKAQ